MIREHLTRQLGILPNEKTNVKINVIGAGAIGSFVVLALAKMGFEDIDVWDFDEVDVVNLNAQFYRFQDIGKKKVDALKEIVREFANVEIKTHDKYEGGALAGYVISAVDSMAVRGKIFDEQRLSPSCIAILDPRMSAESAALYKVNPMNLDEVAQYELTLYSDENSVQERCTAKATMYTVNLIAGYTAKLVKDLCTAENCIPFLTWNIKADELAVGGKTDEQIIFLRAQLAAEKNKVASAEKRLAEISRPSEVTFDSVRLNMYTEMQKIYNTSRPPRQERSRGIPVRQGYTIIDEASVELTREALESARRERAETHE